MAKKTTKLSLSDITPAPTPVSAVKNEQIAAQPLTPDTTPGRKVTQSDRELFAKATAERLVTNTDLISELNATVAARAQSKLGPVHMLYHVMRTMGCKLPTEKEPDIWADPSQVMRGWPKAGTQAEGLGLKGKPVISPNAGRWSDYYGKQVFVDGESDVVTGSFCEDLYHDMDDALGAASLRNQWKFLNDAISDNPTLADNPYNVQTKQWCKSERARVKQALADGQNKLRLALQVYDKIIELYDEFNGTIHIMFNTETWHNPNTNKKETVLARTPAMLVIVDAERPRVGQEFEISAFLALDVNKAVKDGGEYQNIIDSGKKTREPTPPGTRKKLDADAISKFGVPSFVDAMVLLGHFYDDDGKVSALWKHLGKPEHEIDLITIGDVAFKLANMFMQTKGVELTTLGKRWKTATGEKPEEQTAA